MLKGCVQMRVALDAVSIKIMKYLTYNIRVCECVSVPMCVHVRLRVCMHACMCACACACACVRVCAWCVCKRAQACAHVDDW